MTLAIPTKLVIGIRNAWDLAVWIPLQERNPDRKTAGAANARTPAEAASDE